MLAPIPFHQTDGRLCGLFEQRFQRAFMPQCGRLRSTGDCGFEPTDPLPQKIEDEMQGAPYWPQPEGGVLRFTRSAARLNEIFGTGFSPRGFGLAAALSPGVAHADGDHEPGQISIHDAAAPIAADMEFFHNWIWFPIFPAIFHFAANDAAAAERP